MVRRIDVIATWVLVSVTGTSPADDLYRLSVQRLRQAREEIRTITARIRMETKDFSTGKTTVRICEWYQDGEAIRWKEVFDGPPVSPPPGVAADKMLPQQRTASTTEGVVADGRGTKLVAVKPLGKGPDRRLGSLFVPNGQDWGFANLWMRANFLVRDSPSLPLAEILDGPDWSGRATIVTNHGKKLVHLSSCGPKGGHILARLDPDNNYLVQRMMLCNDATGGERGPGIEFETTEFQRPTTSIAFPKRTVMRILAKDGPNRLMVQTDTLIDPIQINTALAASTFRLEIPRGVYVHDSIQNLDYTMGADGKPAADPPPVPHLPVPESSKVMAVNEPVDEDSSHWPWLVAVALVALVATAWRWTRRHRSIVPNH